MSSEYILNLAKGPSEPPVLHQICSLRFAQKSVSVIYSDAQLLCLSVSRVSRWHYCIVGDSNLCHWLVPDLCIAAPAAAGFYLTNTFLLPVLYTQCMQCICNPSSCLPGSLQCTLDIFYPAPSWNSTREPRVILEKYLLTTFMYLLISKKWSHTLTVSAFDLTWPLWCLISESNFLSLIGLSNQKPGNLCSFILWCCVRTQRYSCSLLRH